MLAKHHWSTDLWEKNTRKKLCRPLDSTSFSRTDSSKGWTFAFSCGIVRGSRDSGQSHPYIIKVTSRIVRRSYRHHCLWSHSGHVQEQDRAVARRGQSSLPRKRGQAARWQQARSAGRNERSARPSRIQHLEDHGLQQDQQLPGFMQNKRRHRSILVHPGHHSQEHPENSGRSSQPFPRQRINFAAGSGDNAARNWNEADKE